MSLHGVVATKLKGLLMYNIQGLKLGALACLVFAIMMGATAFLVNLRYGSNSSFWLLLVLSVTAVSASWWSKREIRRRLAQVSSRTFKR